MISAEGTLGSRGLRLEIGESVAALAPEWDLLADELEASPFARPGWIAAWWGAFGAGRLQILHARRGDRLAGVVPLIRSRMALAATTNAHTPEFAILALDEGVAFELCRALMEEVQPHISVGALDPDAPGSRALLAAASAAGRSTVVTAQRQSPYIALDRGWARPETKLDRRLASDLRRRQRRLEEQGQLRFHVEDGRRDLDALLDEGFAIEGSGWKNTRGTAIRSQAATRRFYTDVARWAAARGSLRLAFLRLDDDPVAFQFALEDSYKYYFVKGGYAPGYARFAVGKLLVRFTLETAASRGLRSYEFLGDAEPWKLEWTGALRRRVLVETFHRTPAGLVAQAVRMLALRGRSLAKRIVHRVR